MSEQENASNPQNPLLSRPPEDCGGLTFGLMTPIFVNKPVCSLIDMSAPGGSNEGQGYLNVSVLLPGEQFEEMAKVTYPIVGNGPNALRLYHPRYKFGGLRLYPAWTNLNSQGFLIDSDGIPYPK
jgi:hypothetical protein